MVAPQAGPEARPILPFRSAILTSGNHGFAEPGVGMEVAASLERAVPFRPPSAAGPFVLLNSNLSDGHSPMCSVRSSFGMSSPQPGHLEQHSRLAFRLPPCQAQPSENCIKTTSAILLRVSRVSGPTQ